MKHDCHYEKKWSLGKSLFEIGMRFGVWRNDLHLYTAFFPVRSMADDHIKNCSYPNFSVVHDFLIESAQPNVSKIKREFSVRESAPVKPPKVKKMRYSKRYLSKVICPAAGSMEIEDCDGDSLD